MGTSPEASDSNASPAIGPASGGLGEVAALAAPLVLSQILITTMGVVDSAIVGRLGASQLAAVGLAGMWVWAISAFFVGASTAVQTFVAQHHGAGDARRCGAWCWQGLGSIVPLACVAAVILFVAAGPIVEILAPKGDVEPLARGYMRARSLGIIGLTLAVSLSSFFRGIGDARTPFIATLIANALNVVLDFGLVYGWFGFPQLGVVGAGIATAISEWIYAAIVAIAFLRPTIARTFDTRMRLPDLDRVRRLWRVGLPIAGQWVTEMAAFAIFTTFVGRMGEAPMAASHAFIQIMSLSFMQAEGISMATSTLVGRYIGADAPAVVERSYRSSLWLGTGLTAIIALLFVTLPERLIGLFTTDPDVLAHAAPLLTIGAFYQYCDSMAIVSDGALRGAGDTKWPFLMRGGLAWFVMLPLGWFFAFPLDLGLVGAWWGALIAMATLSLLLFARFRSGAWRRIQI